MTIVEITGAAYALLLVVVFAWCRHVAHEDRHHTEIGNNWPQHRDRERW